MSMAKKELTPEQKREKARFYARKWRAARRAERMEKEGNEEWELVTSDVANAPTASKVTTEVKVISGSSSSFSMTPGTSVELVNDLKSLRDLIRGPRV